MYKNIASQKIIVYAHNALSDEPETGDAGNITAYIAQDAASIAQSDDVNPTELDATNMKGLYVFDLTQAESNANVIALSAVSSTSNVKIEPVVIHTQTTMRGTDDAVDAVLDEAVEGAITLRQAVRLFLSVLSGKSSGGGTSTITFRNMADDKDRVKVTVDSSGNRSAVITRDGT